MPSTATSSTKAIVLLSGGLDSTTCLALAQQQGFDCHALSFSYGQRHSLELQAAQNIAERFGVTQHVVANIDLGMFGGSALTADIDVPKADDVSAIEDSVPITYVPARNTIFLSMALAWAEVLECQDIFIGVNAVDYSGYPDCRPEFIEAFTRMANLATCASTEMNRPLTIHTPLIELTKAEIIKTGLELGVDYAMTRSCYDPAADGTPCGHCDSCLLRTKGFGDLGMTDPLLELKSES